MSETPVTPVIDEKNGNAVIAKLLYVGTTAEEAMKNYNDAWGTFTRVIRDAVILALCKLLGFEKPDEFGAWIAEVKQFMTDVKTSMEADQLWKTLGFNNPGEFVSEFERLRELEKKIPGIVDAKINAYFTPARIESLAIKVKDSNKKHQDEVRENMCERIEKTLPLVFSENLNWGEFSASDMSEEMLETLMPRRGSWIVNTQDTDIEITEKLATWLNAKADETAQVIYGLLGYSAMPKTQKESIIAVSRLTLKHFGMTSDQLQKFIDAQIEKSILTRKR